MKQAILFKKKFEIC